MTLRYTLRIEAPDGFDIPGEDNYDEPVMDSILADSEPHDTTLEAQVLRWLGDAIQGAENLVDLNLPDGWYCKIEEAR